MNIAVWHNWLKDAGQIGVCPLLGLEVAPSGSTQHLPWPYMEAQLSHGAEEGSVFRLGWFPSRT